MDDAELASELRTVIGRASRQLRKQTNFDGYSITQRNVLAMIARDGSSTLTLLARAEGMRPQSMGPIVASLERAGLVAGAPDPGDGRQTILTLTEQAVDQVREGRAAKDDWLLRTMTERLSADERAGLTAAVPLLRRVFEPQEKSQ